MFVLLESLILSCNKSYWNRLCWLTYVFFVDNTKEKAKKKQKKVLKKRAEIQNIFLALQISSSFQRNISSVSDLKTLKCVA